MKRLLTIALLTALFSTNSLAQNNKVTKIINQGYYEFNFGAAFIDDIQIPFPGLSFLIGNKAYFKNNMILDTQIGIALPSIATAKIGVGFKGRNGEVIVGIRPWPMHVYLQTQLNTTDRGGWIMSFELSAYTLSGPRRSYNDAAYDASMMSLGMLNFGYRWNM